MLNHVDYSQHISYLRFRKKIAKGRTADDCDTWTAGKHPYGYGMFNVPGAGVQYAHRLAYEYEHGPIPDGLCVLHDCDTPTCVNPEHLFLGTRTDNMSDKVAKNRQAYGEDFASAKLTDRSVLAIRRMLAAKIKGKEIARIFGVSPALISHIKRNRNWKHVRAGRV